MPGCPISSGYSFERDIGHRCAVACGNRMLVSGITDFDFAAMTISEDSVINTRKCLRNIEAALPPGTVSIDPLPKVPERIGLIWQLSVSCRLSVEPIEGGIPQVPRTKRRMR